MPVRQEETISVTPTEYVEEIVLQQPSPTPTPFITVEEAIPSIEVVEEPKEISLVGSYENLSIESDDLSDWYRSFFKEVEIKECPLECSKEQIEDLLNSGGEWRLVQHGQVLYTHSGWPIVQGPSFGEFFLRIERDGDLRETGFCLDTVCFKIIDYTVLSRDQIGGLISVDEIFEVQEGNFFLVTCSSRLIPGLQTPKLILQLQIVS